MFLTVRAASSPQPPRVSTTMGMKVTPTEWQPSEWAALFLSSPTERAWPRVTAASFKVSCWRVERLGRPVVPSSSWEGTRRRGGCWFQGSERAPPSWAQEHQFELQRITRPGRSHACGFCPHYRHNPSDGHPGDRPPLGK